MSQVPERHRDRAEPSTGVGNLCAELISGNLGNACLPAMVAGREKQIESAFLADKDNRDLSDWIGNSTPEQPADLGYWVGYRITKAYYLRANDKRQALREILQMRDAEAFLAASGWYPGMKL